MNKSEVLQNVLLGLASLVLVGVLAFLYDKTQALDLREQNEILGPLRELREIDDRWDVDVLRARLELGVSEPAISRTAAAEKALQALDDAAIRTKSPTLATGLPELVKAIREKAKLVERFGTTNSEASNALRTMLAAAAELRAQALESKPRRPDLEAATSRLAAGASQYQWLGLDAQRRDLEAALGELRNAAPAAASATLSKVLLAAEALLKHKPAERDLLAKLASLTPGPRLDAMTFSYNRELEGTLLEKERFRVYLIAYAAALLILLAWFGAKIRAANIHLEHRVEERTRELSEALKRLKESEAQLIQSEKMSSLGQMVAGVAHEINTPLAYVKNSLGAVADKLPDLGDAVEQSETLLALLQGGASANAEELSRQFALVTARVAKLKQQNVMQELTGLVKDGLHGTGQMAEIVGNLKDFSRLDRSKVTSFNLNEGLASTLLLAKHLLKSVLVKRQLGDIPAIVCSPSQINQVFLNLITNAAQAMANERGTISLTTRAAEGGVTVEVADDGRGIASEVLPKIFDPFFSTKEIGKGTGLGLSISYKIVQQHGGRIDVESQVGAGTRFTVWLPLKPPAEAELAA
jgi:two-component system NtrC family sensor kinase